MDIIEQGMISSLEILYNFSALIGFPNYGIAIILLTIIIKTLIYPLTYKQMYSMRKMVDLQPKMKAIQEKYKNNKEKANAAMMEFYKENKVNPMGGCLPLIIQLPIFYALYKALIDFPYESTAAATFLYFDLTKSYGFSLSYYLILPIFAAATTYLQTKITNPNPSDPTQKTMLYIMPIFFAYICATVPSGLALYWVTMNIVSILQQFYINKKIAASQSKSAV